MTSSEYMLCVGSHTMRFRYDDDRHEYDRHDHRCVECGSLYPCDGSWCIVDSDTGVCPDCE